MGHGCYYTTNENDSKAFWIDLIDLIQNEEYDEDEHFYLFDDTINDIKDCLSDTSFYHKEKYKMENGLYELIFEGGYGDKLIIKLEPKETYQQGLYNLAKANHQKCYDKIAKSLIKIGYELRIASSGYTSTSLSFK